MSKSVFIKTFGCQMNSVDSARMLAVLSESDYVPAPSLEDADLVLINTCSIREKADQKIFSDLGTLRRWKQLRPGRRIGVAGCLAQQEGEALRRRAPHIDIVFGTRGISDLPGMIREVETGGTVRARMHGEEAPNWDVFPYRSAGAVSSMITIMEGCDNFCAYCVVPLVRGREKSRPPGKILDEIRGFAENGGKEIILLGQNVNSYGKNGGGVGFPELLRQISRVEGISRIRFLTSHPRDLDDRTIGLFGEIEMLCPHLHLPLQSGSDRVLAAMGRGYTVSGYLSKIQALRNVRPEIAFSSDFIVGFPGETEDDFRKTLEVMERVRYDSSFSFRYSPRPGTRAAEMDGRIPSEAAALRLRLLQEIQARHTRERLAAMVGKEATVLVEGKSARDPGRLCGRTGCGKMVNFLPAAGDAAFRTVFITSSGSHTLSGEERGARG